MMKYSSILEFDREFKKLKKKFKSLAEDFERVKINVIELNHIKGIDNKSIEKLSGIGNTEDFEFWKIRKFACQYLKGKGAKSGLRVTYAFFPKLSRVVFLEIYFKADKEEADRKRIIEFRKKIERGDFF